MYNDEIMPNRTHLCSWFNERYNLKQHYSSTREAIKMTHFTNTLHASLVGLFINRIVSINIPNC